MNFLKTHRVWISSAVAGVILFLTPSVTAYFAAHPQVGVAGATAWAIATAWAKSPRQ
jgi:hypothetical protein